MPIALPADVLPVIEQISHLQSAERAQRSNGARRCVDAGAGNGCVASGVAKPKFNPQTAAVAELETGLIGERTKAALAAAKQREVKLGVTDATALAPKWKAEACAWTVNGCLR